jgi:type III polyketide synthase
MSPPRDQAEAPRSAFGTFGDLDLSVIGIGVEYPPYKLGPEALDTLCKRHYPETPAYACPKQLAAHLTDM